MKKILLLLFAISTLTAFSQDVDRITVNGRIVVASDDKEGVAVFNSSSNQGTYTDADGNFEIKVALNDVVQFAALQFKDFNVTITEKVLISKRLTVILVEEVNKLDEVVILPFDLTGNLAADLESVRTYNVSLDDVYFGLDNIEDFEFTTDYKTETDNLAFNEYNPHMENMIDLVNVAGFLIKQVINTDKENKKRAMQLEKSPFKKALDTYSVNFIHNNFEIPLDKVNAFIDYVEKEGIDDSLFEDNKEMQLLERISQLSKAFLKQPSEKE